MRVLKYRINFRKVKNFPTVFRLKIKITQTIYGFHSHPRFITPLEIKLKNKIITLERKFKYTLLFSPLYWKVYRFLQAFVFGISVVLRKVLGVRERRKISVVATRSSI